MLHARHRVQPHAARAGGSPPQDAVAAAEACGEEVERWRRRALAAEARLAAILAAAVPAAGQL